MTATIDERVVPASAPFQCDMLSNYFCRTSYVFDQYPWALPALNAVIYGPLIWSWAAISIILKDKLGIRKRVTLGALAALGVAYVIGTMALGVAIAIFLGLSGA